MREFSCALLHFEFADLYNVKTNVVNKKIKISVLFIKKRSVLNFNPCKSNMENQRMLHKLGIKWDYEFRGIKLEDRNRK